MEKGPQRSECKYGVRNFAKAKARHVVGGEFTSKPTDEKVRKTPGRRSRKRTRN